MSKEIADLCANVICLHDRLNVAEKHIAKAETFRAIKTLAINSVIDAITQQITMLSLLGYEFKDMRAEVSKAQQEAAQAFLAASTKEEPVRAEDTEENKGVRDQGDYVDVRAGDLDYGQIIMWGGEPWLVKSIHQRPDDSVNLDVVNLIGERDPYKLTLENEHSVLRWKAHE